MKYLKFITCATFALALTCSCGDDPANPNDSNGDDSGTEIPGGGTNNDSGEKNSGDGTGEISENALASTEQQTKMQTVAKEFLGYFSADDFRYWSDLAHHINDKYVSNESFNNDVVEKWYEELASVTILGQTENRNEDYYYSYVNVYTQKEKLYLLANIKGKFTAESREWKRETATNLQFIAKDHNGDLIEATLTTSGPTKKVRLHSDRKWNDNRYDGHTNYYYCDENTYIVELPEQIIVTYRAAGKERMKFVLNTKVSDMKEDKFYVNTSSVAASSTLKIDDYTITVSNLAYTPNGNAGADVTFSKGATLLTSASVSVGDWNMSGDGFFDNLNGVDIIGGIGTIRFNILNKIQTNATVTDARAFVDAYNEADDERYNESAVKSAAAKMNRYVKAGLYYSTKEKQAAFSFEPFLQNSYSGRWKVYPVIEFADGSSYSLFEETDFFNHDVFDDVIKLFNKLVDDFEALAD